MTDDDAPAESHPEQDHPLAKTYDRTQQASGRHKRTFLPTLLKGWRALAFLLIVMIVGYYAFHYKALSDPGSESRQLANNAPQELDFFVSNPSVSIDVNVTMLSLLSSAVPDYWYPHIPQSSNEYVAVTVHAPRRVKNVTILVLTNNFSPAEDEPPGLIVPAHFSRLVTLSQSPLGYPQIPDGYFAAVVHIYPSTNLDIPLVIENDLEQTNAYLYGHLPAVGTIDQLVDSQQPPGYPPPPGVLSESYKNAPYRIRDLVLEPEPLGPATNEAASNLKSYRTPYGGPGGLFWAPAKLSITEIQSNLGATIANQQINYMTPAGQASGPDYVWQGSTYLEPMFQTVNGDALRSEGDYAFLSGVLFGVAGAAGIAFVQEIPETFNKPVWWSRRKRKRRSSSQNATDEKPDSTEGEKEEVEVKPISITSKSSTGLGWPSSTYTGTKKRKTY